jgi:hypothetical protein
MDNVTRGFNDTTLGLLKAAHNLEAQSRKKLQQPTKRPAYSYAKVGNVVHATSWMPAEERLLLDAALHELRTIDPDTEFGNQRAHEVLSSLSHLNCHYVPIKQATKIDYSKRYPYRSTKRTAPRLAA